MCRHGSAFIIADQEEYGLYTDEISDYSLKMYEGLRTRKDSELCAAQSDTCKPSFNFTGPLQNVAGNCSKVLLQATIEEDKGLKEFISVTMPLLDE